jgi:hypothetical protein
MDLNGNVVEQVAPGGSLPTPGRLAVMAATGGDMRILLLILIMLQIPIGDVLSAAGC